MKKVSAVVVGGSNCVMRPGFLTELPQCMHRVGIDLSILANLSVGNTTILMGLLNLKANEKAIKAADVLLVEYTLNDTSVYASSPDGLKRWLRGMEGVIRFARTIKPSIKIIPIIFATRTGMHRETMNPLHGGVHYLSNYYGLAVADVNAAFIARFGRDFFDLPGSYGDFAHYQRPVFTRLAAEVIAERARDYLLSRSLPGPLPPPIDAENHSGSGIILASDLKNLATDRFRNHLYDEATVDLASGVIDFEIEGGTILAVKYVCTEDAAQCYIEANGAWYQCLTLQAAMEEPKYKFLLSMLDLDGLPAAEGLNRISLTGVKPQTDSFTNIRQYGARQPVRAEARLPIAAILHTGKLKSVSVSQVDEPVTEPAE